MTKATTITDTATAIDACRQLSLTGLAPELDGLFGEHPRETLLGLVGHPAPLGLTSLYGARSGSLTITDDLGAPNLAALPVLLLWLYPDKLPLAYAVRTAQHARYTAIISFNA